MSIRRTSAGRTVLAVGLLLIGALAAGTLVAGCTDSSRGDAKPTPPAARPVTSEEAERLAVTRFRNFDAGTRSVRATFTDSGHKVELAGYYDYAHHAGAGTVLTDGRPVDTITWNGELVAVSPDRPTSAGPGDPPASIDGWTVGTLDPSRSNLETVLAVLAAFGADRPENPLLLAQSGALWLREDTVDRTPVTVFAGPTSTASASPTANPPAGSPDPDASGLRYWIDKTGLAHRIQIRLGGGWAAVDLDDGDGITVRPLPQRDTSSDKGSEDTEGG